MVQNVIPTIAMEQRKTKRGLLSNLNSSQVAMNGGQLPQITATVLSDSGNTETTSPLPLQLCPVIHSQMACAGQASSWGLQQDSQVAALVAHWKASYVERRVTSHMKP